MAMVCVNYTLQQYSGLRRYVCIASIRGASTELRWPAPAHTSRPKKAPAPLAGEFSRAVPVAVHAVAPCARATRYGFAKYPVVYRLSESYLCRRTVDPSRKPSLPMAMGGCGRSGLARRPSRCRAVRGHFVARESPPGTIAAAGWPFNGRSGLS